MSETNVNQKKKLFQILKLKLRNIFVFNSSLTKALIKELLNLLLT